MSDDNIKRGMAKLTPEFCTSLVDLHADMHNVARNQEADTGTFSYRYADLASILEVVRPILAKHGFAVLQELCPGALGEAHLRTTLLHVSGGFTTSMFSMPSGTRPQEVGSAVSYARRYALMAVLGIAAEDDDGSAAQKGFEERLPPPMKPGEMREVAPLTPRIPEEKIKEPKHPDWVYNENVGNGKYEGVPWATVVADRNEFERHAAFVAEKTKDPTERVRWSYVRDFFAGDEIPF